MGLTMPCPPANSYFEVFPQHFRVCSEKRLQSIYLAKMMSYWGGQAPILIWLVSSWRSFRCRHSHWENDTLSQAKELPEARREGLKQICPPSTLGTWAFSLHSEPAHVSRIPKSLSLRMLTSRFLSIWQAFFCKNFLMIFIFFYIRSFPYLLSFQTFFPIPLLCLLPPIHASSWWDIWYLHLMGLLLHRTVWLVSWALVTAFTDQDLWT